MPWNLTKKLHLNLKPQWILRKIIEKECMKYNKTTIRKKNCKITIIHSICIYIYINKRILN